MPNSSSIFTTPQDYLRQADQDRALLRRIASADEDALAGLFDAYAPLLGAEALRILWSVHHAEEVLQEVFLELWRLPLAAADVTACARLVALTRDRSLLRARSHPPRPLEPGVSPSLRESGALGSGSLAAKGSVLERTAKEIPGAEQRALALAFYEGLSLAEIGRVLGTTPEEALRLVGDALLALHHGTTVARLTVCSKNAEFPRAAAASSLGALDAEAAERFRAHLEGGCGVCRQDLTGFRETMALLPFLLAPAPVSPDVKERILFAIRLSQVAAADADGRPPAPPEPEPAANPLLPAGAQAPAHALPKRPWMTLVGVFAGLVLLVAAAAYVNTLIEKVDQQATFIQDQETYVARLTTELDSRRAVLGIIESPDLQVVVFRGVGEAAGGHGKLFWDARRNEGVLQVSHVTDPDGREEFRLRIVGGGRDTAQVALLAIDDSDSARSYFAVKDLPPALGAKGASYEIVRGARGAAADTLLMTSVPGR